MDKIKLVVYNEYALGYILPQRPNQVCILANSILRGASLRVYDEPYPIGCNDKIRLASEKDFEDYRVCFEGFDNPEMYEFDDANR